MHRVLGLPPVAPCLRLAAHARPLDARRQVADHRVEPDVDPLVRVLGVAGDRDAHSPVEVARHRTRPDVVDQPEREVADVRAPAGSRLDPAPQRVGERRQVEEEMVRLAELGRRAVDLRARIDQVGRVELIAAVVALVAARLGIAADRARALDVAVGERVPGRRGERDELGPFDDRAVLVERLEEVLCDARVIRRRRAREAVVGEPKPAEVLTVRLVVEVGYLTVGLPFRVCGHHHRRPVLVGATHGQHVVALEPVVAREHVERYVRRRVTQVPEARRIGPCRRHQNLLSARSHGGQ